MSVVEGRAVLPFESESRIDRAFFGWLKEAGFGQIEWVPLPGPAGLIVGTKPGAA